MRLPEKWSKKFSEVKSSMSKRFSEVRISMPAFYQMGFWCFSIMTVANSVNFFVQFSTRNIWSHIVAAGTIAFGVMLALLFWTQMHSGGLDLSKSSEGISQDEMEQAFEEAKEKKP